MGLTGGVLDIFHPIRPDSSVKKANMMCTGLGKVNFIHNEEVFPPLSKHFEHLCFCCLELTLGLNIFYTYLYNYIVWRVFMLLNSRTSSMFRQLQCVYFFQCLHGVMCELSFDCFP